MKRKTKTESGFTLLELLISMAMVAVLVISCLMAVRLAIASRESGIQKTDLHQRLRVLHQRLNSTLRSAHLIFVSVDSKSLIANENQEKSGNSKILAFDGKPKSLKFVTFSEKLMGGNSSPSMHEVYFYLQKNEDTGSLDLLVNERDFSPENFFKQDSPEFETGQTLRIAQDVAYLKFRYHYQISEEGNSSVATGEKPIKVSGEWTDTMTTEPFDFKSNIVGDKGTGEGREAIRLPRAVEISVGLWKPGRTGKGLDPPVVQLPPTVIPLQAGMVFKRFDEEEEIRNAPKE